MAEYNEEVELHNDDAKDAHVDHSRWFSPTSNDDEVGAVVAPARNSCGSSSLISFKCPFLHKFA